MEVHLEGHHVCTRRMHWQQSGLDLTARGAFLLDSKGQCLQEQRCALQTDVVRRARGSLARIELATFSVLG